MFWDLVSQLQPSQWPRLLPIALGRPRQEQPLPQANSPTCQESISNSTTNQEGQTIVDYAFIARDYQQSPIVAIITRVVQRGQPNGSRGLEEGDVSKPQIPCSVNWCVSRRKHNI
jgi:hypothetical protein